jgi:RHS repeat-associated protein
MDTRIIGGQTVHLGYDAENRLVSVTGVNGTTTSAVFTYNGDGQKVKSVINGETTLLVGGHFEVLNPGTGQTVTKYYFAGASRIAMRKYTIPQSMMVEYVLGDHLGSTSVTTDNTGSKVSEMRYEPWGEVRYAWTSGQSTTPAYKLPVYTFTGQRSFMDDPSTTAVEGFGLLDYNARMYDPYLNRFTQPDSIVPLASQGTQAWDRFSYVNNNPVRFTDSTGHMLDQGESGGDSESSDDCGTSENNDNGSSVPPPPIKTRVEWGAYNPGAFGGGTEGQYPANSNGYANYSDLAPGVSLDGILHTIVIHHEGNWQTYDVLQVQYDQMQGGYYDIAYHFVIGQDGTIYQGRDISVRGAHVESANTGRIGILWLGDFEPGLAFSNGIHLPFDLNGTDSAPTLSQLSSTVWLTMWLDSVYGIDSVVGHNDLNKDSVCPGANADPYIPPLNDIVTGE